jgi:hypothetical protein
MDKIDLQAKTQALPGTIESFWFKNEAIGLEKTLFHRVSIPLSPFDSGLEYETQPISATIEFDWYKLGLSDPGQLDGLDLSHSAYPDAEASMYVGGAHNWCQIHTLKLSHIEKNTYRIVGELLVEFENEGVAKNERFKFSTTVMYANS